MFFNGSFVQAYAGQPAFQILPTPIGAWQWSTIVGPSPGIFSADDTLRTMILYFESVLLGALEMKTDPMLDLIDMTNNRIFAALYVCHVVSGKTRVWQYTNTPHSKNLDAQIALNPGGLFGANTAPWTAAFGTTGIAGAYRTFMTNTILPQITVPSAYLTLLWNWIKQGITDAHGLPDVATDATTGNAPGPHLAAWQQYDNFATAIDNLYAGTGLNAGRYDWEYTFAFSWNVAHVKRQDDGDDDDPTSLIAPSDLTCTATQSSSSLTSSSTSSSSSTTTPSTTRPPTTTRSSTTSSTRSTTTSSTTSQPPRVAAPDITMSTPTETPDCVAGYQTWTLKAVASAQANAASLKFIIPKADTPGTNWKFDLSPGFVVDPKTDVESWKVATSDTGPPITSGDGGKDMDISWQAPTGASTYNHTSHVNRDRTNWNFVRTQRVPSWSFSSLTTTHRWEFKRMASQR